MKILLACESSGILRDEFRKRGHDATSCDLLETERPGPHHKGDVREILGDGWDMMIAFPSCQYVAASGLHWNKKRPERAAKTEEALAFVRTLLDAPIGRIGLENPIGAISSRIRKPDQIIQPWYFGEDASKSTCLWLKHLRPLVPTRKIPPSWACCGNRLGWSFVKPLCPSCGGKKRALHVWGNQTTSGQNKLAPDVDRWKDRARTYQGVAAAMADQWGSYEAYKGPEGPQNGVSGVDPLPRLRQLPLLDP